MKRNIIIAAVIIAALAFGVTSCKKDERKCWKVTFTENYQGVPLTFGVYWWCTETDCDLSIENTKKTHEYIGATDITYVKEEASQYTTQADCDAKNYDENGGCSPRK